MSAPQVAPQTIPGLALVGAPKLGLSFGSSWRDAMKPWSLLTLLAALAWAPVAGADAQNPTGEDLAQSAGAPLSGKYAPPLTLTTSDGRKIELAKFYGKKPVYLKFWATWCVPCR